MLGVALVTKAECVFKSLGRQPSVPRRSSPTIANVLFQEHELSSILGTGRKTCAGHSQLVDKSMAYEWPVRPFSTYTEEIGIDPSKECTGGGASHGLEGGTGRVKRPAILAKPSSADQSGKVFRVEHGMHRCMVCEELFSRAASARHANVVCWPEQQLSPQIWQAQTSN